MSSSRPSSRSSRAAASGPCPTCGSSRVRTVREEVTLRIRGVNHRFPEVPHEKCDACGERIFGIDASKRFDALIPRRRRSRAA
jgi:YgiT-type zinc finger domain-containing protein